MRITKCSIKIDELIVSSNTVAEPRVRMRESQAPIVRRLSVALVP